MPERRIEIFDIELLSYEPPEARISVHCSKGTYIRAIARDLAAACGTSAYLTRLRRIGVGPFSLSEALSDPREEDLIPLESVASRLGTVREVEVSTEESLRLAQGAKVDQVLPASRLAGGEPYRAFLGPEGRVVAIAEAREEGFSYILVRP